MAQSPTTDAPLRLPLVSTISSRTAATSADSNSMLDSRMINCYAELDPSDGEYWIEKRIGYAAASPVGTGTGHGMFGWTVGSYAVIGTHIWKNTGLGTWTDLGAINGDNLYKFTLIGEGSTARLMVLGNGSKAYYSDANGNVITQIVDADFPATFCPGWAYLDGTLYVMDANGTIHGSDVDNPASWNALNVINAQIESDGGIALAKHLVYVVALKAWSTEFFYDAGNATGSPLAPIQGAFLPFGCASAYSVADLDGTLIWVTRDKNISYCQVVRIDNMQLTIISTPPVEKLLGKAGLNTMRGFTIKFAGHRWYILNVDNLNFSLIYDLDQKLWYIWTDTTGAAQWPIVDHTVDVVGNQIIQHKTNGAVYITDTDFVYPSDAGTVPPVDIYTRNFDAGLDRIKTLPIMRFDGDQTKGSILKVRVNDNDFQSDKWSNFREVNLGNERPILPDCASFRRRAWNLRHQSNTSFRIKATYLQLDKGSQ